MFRIRKQIHFFRLVPDRKSRCLSLVLHFRLQILHIQQFREVNKVGKPQILETIFSSLANHLFEIHITIYTNKMLKEAESRPWQIVCLIAVILLSTFINAFSPK